MRTYGIAPDSGGPGRYRGGCGIVREYEILAEETTMAIRIDGVQNPPWGMAGGMSGGGGRAIINPGTPHARELAPLSDGNLLKRGDVVRIETGGGGGHGHPYDRPEADVIEDVLGGFVSQASAERHYGVVINGTEIDRDATAARRANRPPVRAFHRHGYVDALV